MTAKKPTLSTGRADILQALGAASAMLAALKAGHEDINISVHMRRCFATAIAQAEAAGIKVDP